MVHNNNEAGKLNSIIRKRSPKSIIETDQRLSEMRQTKEQGIHFEKHQETCVR